MTQASFTAAIIEDEPDGHPIIFRLLTQYFPSIRLTGQAQGISRGVQLLNEQRPDFLFLDVEMQDGNAFDLLAACTHRPKHVILLTTCDNYAIIVVKTCCLDYLSKPVDEKAFLRIVTKGILAAEVSLPQKPVNVLMDIYKRIVVRKVRVPTIHGFLLVNVDEIIRCEALGNYTSLHLAGRPSIIACRKLGQYEKELEGQGFVRIHKKHLVSVIQIIEYHKGNAGGGYITLANGTVLEVSVRQKSSLMQAL